MIGGHRCEMVSRLCDFRLLQLNMCASISTTLNSPLPTFSLHFLYTFSPLSPCLLPTASCHPLPPRKVVVFLPFQNQSLPQLPNAKCFVIYIPLKSFLETQNCHAHYIEYRESFAHLPLPLLSFDLPYQSNAWARSDCC